MHFTTALVLYIILLILILAAMWRMGINLFSAITVALLLSGVFLLILIPPTELEKYTDNMIDGCDRDKRNDVAIGIFCAIFLVTLVVIIWYILNRAYCDRKPQFHF